MQLISQCVHACVREKLFFVCVFFLSLIMCVQLASCVHAYVYERRREDFVFAVCACLLPVSSVCVCV